MQQFRHELKYIISQAQIPLLRLRIDQFMKLDQHVVDTGFYNIRSLYFDDFQNSSYYEKVASKYCRKAETALSLHRNSIGKVKIVS